MFFQFSNFFFLYYSWLEIKKYEFFLNIKFKQFCLVPVRKAWFFKVQFLLNSSSYLYPRVRLSTSNSPLNVNKVVIVHRSKVVENALFNLIFPFFNNYYSFKTYSFIIYSSLIL